MRMHVLWKRTTGAMPTQSVVGKDDPEETQVKSSSLSAAAVVPTKKVAEIHCADFDTDCASDGLKLVSIFL